VLKISVSLGENVLIIRPALLSSPNEGPSWRSMSVAIQRLAIYGALEKRAAVWQVGPNKQTKYGNMMR